MEHFRPQSVYWWLAYCYGNYVYACQICNQDWKGAQFPVAAARLAGPKVLSTSTDQELDALAGTLGPDPLDANAIRQFHAGAASEIPHLPDPYVVDPEPLFAWRADDTLREVDIRARDDSLVSQRAHAAAEQCLGLNRDELLRARYTIYAPAMLLVRAIKSGKLDPALAGEMEAELRVMTSSSGQFAAMLRYFVEHVEGLVL